MNIVEHNGKRYELVKVDDKTVVSRLLPDAPKPAVVERPAPAVQGSDKPKIGRPRKAA